MGTKKLILCLLMTLSLSVFANDTYYDNQYIQEQIISQIITRCDAELKQTLINMQAAFDAKDMPAYNYYKWYYYNLYNQCSAEIGSVR